MATRILVPLDGSSLAEQALPCAATLARELPAELVLLHAIWIPPDILRMLEETALDSTEVVTELVAEANGYLGTLVEQLREAALIANPVVRRGPAAEMILDYARQTNVDMIVMATHGYSGFKRWTHGSIAERVLQRAPMPLLLVRVEPDLDSDWRQPARCHQILTLLDGSCAAEQALSPAAMVAQAMGGEMILFHVLPAQASGRLAGAWNLLGGHVPDTAEQDAQAYLRRVADHLQGQGLRIATATSVGPAAECIIEYAEANNIDLIAMCTHGRTGVARWALGSVADRVLRAGSKPILLARCRECEQLSAWDDTTE